MKSKYCLTMKLKLLFYVVLILGFCNCDKDSEPEPPNNNEAEVIAFCSDQTGNGDIYVMEADGSNPRRVTTNSNVDYWPGWSPDGIQIAFGSIQNENVDIYTINIDGSERSRLTTHSAGDFERVDFLYSNNGDGTFTKVN